MSGRNVGEQQDMKSQLLLLQEGRVAEQGSHAQLMELRGLYYDLWSKQEAGSTVNLNGMERPSSAAKPT